MRKFSKRKLGVIAASISLTLLTTSVLAAEHHGHGAGNTELSTPTPRSNAGGMMNGDMMAMMKGMHALMHSGAGGHMMGTGMMDENVQSYDTNGDGTTSVEELRNALLAELENYDTDDSGTLAIGEFEGLHAARIRNRMVDQFQALDEDGDGQVTAEEMTAPADRMQMRMDRQAAPGSMPGMQGGAMQPSADDKN